MKTISTKTTHATAPTALAESGATTPASAQALLRGLDAPMKGPANLAARGAVAKDALAVTPKTPDGYVTVHVEEIVGGPRSPYPWGMKITGKEPGAVHDHALSRLSRSAMSDLNHHLPSHLSPSALASPAGQLLRAVKDVAKGATNFMDAQRHLVEAREAGFARGERATGFPPREFETRLAKAIAPFGVTLDDLPDALRVAGKALGLGKAQPEQDARLQRAANAFEDRKGDVSYQTVTRTFTPAFKVEDRRYSWQLSLEPAPNGQQYLDLVKGKGAPPAAGKSTGAGELTAIAQQLGAPTDLRSDDGERRIKRSFPNLTGPAASSAEKAPVAAVPEPSRAVRPRLPASIRAQVDALPRDEHGLVLVRDIFDGAPYGYYQFKDQRMTPEQYGQYLLDREENHARNHPAPNGW